MNEYKKVISKADFNKVWGESTKEDILNQFYYEHNDLRELLKENGNKEKVITQLTSNWNELEEWVESEYNRYLNDTENLIHSNVETIDYSRMLDKMKEIKEGNNEQ